MSAAPTTPPTVPTPADVARAEASRLARLVGWCVWLLFFAVVLVPTAAASYGAAAVVRTCREAWRQGWDDHATDGE